MIAGLNDPCGSCRRRSGDHTLDEWAVCLGQPSHVLDFEEVPADVAALLRERFAGLEGYAVADTVDARAAVLDGAAGSVQVALPALLLDFSTGHPTQPPTPRANVAFIGPPEVMRAVGRLIRDTANGAAKAGERAGGRS